MTEKPFQLMAAARDSAAAFVAVVCLAAIMAEFHKEDRIWLISPIASFYHSGGFLMGVVKWTSTMIILVVIAQAARVLVWFYRRVNIGALRPVNPQLIARWLKSWPGSITAAFGITLLAFGIARLIPGQGPAYRWISANWSWADSNHLLYSAIVFATAWVLLVPGIRWSGRALERMLVE